MMHQDVIADSGPLSAFESKSTISFIEKAKSSFSFIFQPIVSISTGQCYGYQAQQQFNNQMHFSNLDNLYEEAQQLGCVNRLVLVIHERIFYDFSRICRKGERLFFGIDKQIQLLSEYKLQQALELMNRFGISPTSVGLELTERLLQTCSNVFKTAANTWLHQSNILVIDKFGSAGGGLMTLRDPRIKMVRLDSGVASEIVADERTRLTVATLVNHAHAFNITIIAGGVTNQGEFLACKNLGVDLAQGSFISPPLTADGVIPRSYVDVTKANLHDRRERQNDVRLLRDEMTVFPTVSVGDPMSKVFDTFKSEKEYAFLPIIDDRQQPVGILREIDLRDVIYSRYGKDLLHNKALHRGIFDFMRPCPVCDINTDAEKILEAFSHAKNPPGVILVDGYEYVGVLTAASLLRVINEKNITQARDESPLTRMPGNRSIEYHISTAFEDRSVCWSFVYFDLDNFKPFNDYFGFRQGDRAILMFSEVMRDSLPCNKTFLGHIGGDDFFARLRDVSPERAEIMVASVLENFKHAAESLYDDESRTRGYIVGRGRDGIVKEFSLLSCSAAMVHLHAGDRLIAIDRLFTTIAKLKKEAKQSPQHLAIEIMM
ncbi:MAG: EAL domain-containing protein [Rhodospirillaceae bacterium]